MLSNPNVDAANTGGVFKRRKIKAGNVFGKKNPNLAKVGSVSGKVGRPKKLQTVAEVEADINLREFQKSQAKLKKEKEKNKLIPTLFKQVENNSKKIISLENIVKLNIETFEIL